MNHVLEALGCLSPSMRQAVATSLYESGRYDSETIGARLLCFAARTSNTLPLGALQITWDEVLCFVYDRYQILWKLKRENQQWPPIGRLLWDRCRDKERDAYVREMRAVFGLPAA